MSIAKELESKAFRVKRGKALYDDLYDAFSCFMSHCDDCQAYAERQEQEDEATDWEAMLGNMEDIEGDIMECERLLEMYNEERIARHEQYEKLWEQLEAPLTQQLSGLNLGMDQVGEQIMQVQKTLFDIIIAPKKHRLGEHKQKSKARVKVQKRAIDEAQKHINGLREELENS